MRVTRAAPHMLARQGRATRRAPPERRFRLRLRVHAGYSSRSRGLPVDGLATRLLHGNRQPETLRSTSPTGKALACDISGDGRPNTSDNLSGMARPETSRMQYGPIRAGPTTPFAGSLDAGREGCRGRRGPVPRRARPHRPGDNPAGSTSRARSYRVRAEPWSPSFSSRAPICSVAARKRRRSRSRIGAVQGSATSSGRNGPR
jgi:hypothetical protein